MFAKYPQSAQKSSPRRKLRCKMCRQELATREHMVRHGLYEPSEDSPPPPEQVGPSATPEDVNPDVDAAVKLGESLSDSLTLSEAEATQNHTLPAEIDQSPSAAASASTPASPPSATSPPQQKSLLSHPSEISAELYSNPALAALRNPIVLALPSFRRQPTAVPRLKTNSAPILAKHECSGYFLEPMKWMEPSAGQMAGKIFCPNARCKAKLGNYDWAGVHCSCKEWVVPGFCIHRSKVDEVE